MIVIMIVIIININIIIIIIIIIIIDILVLILSVIFLTFRDIRCIATSSGAECTIIIICSAIQDTRENTIMYVVAPHCYTVSVTLPWKSSPLCYQFNSAGYRKENTQKENRKILSDDLIRRWVRVPAIVFVAVLLSI